MAKLMFNTIMATGTVAETPKPPEKKSGLFEGLRKRKEASKVFELVKSAALISNGSSAARFQEAIELFRTLEPKHQEKTLLRIQDMLADAARYPFENTTNPRQIHVIADFLTRIAPHLPKDAAGDPITEPYKPALKSLASTVTSYDPDGKHKDHPQVIQACTTALWAMGYSTYNFWVGRAINPPTQEFAITKLLEQPQSGDPKTHTWTLLRDNIEAVGPAIIASPSPKKIEFLKNMFESENPKTATAAFHMVAPMKQVPEELVATAKERKQKAEADIIAVKEAREGLIGPLRSMLAARHTNTAKRQEAKGIIASIREKERQASGPAEMLSATSEFIDMAELTKKIAKGGQDELQGMDTLLGMFASDRGVRFGYIAPFIAYRHARAMKDVLSPDSDLKKQTHALNVLSIYEVHDVKANGIKNNTRYVVDALLDKEPEGWNGILKAYMRGLTFPIMASESKNKLGFLMAMASTEEPQTVQAAFDAVFWMEYIPEEFSVQASAIKADEGKAVLHPIMDDFLDTLRLMDLVEMGNGEQFTAAMALISKYRSGRSALAPVMHGLGIEMVDVMRFPGGSSEDEKVAQRLSALDVVVALIMSHVKVQDSGSVLQGMGKEVAEVVKNPKGSTPEEKEAQVNKSLYILGALTMNGVKIPGAEVTLEKAQEGE
ncbi:hypothetical protein H0O00_01410 [Candidatus Micrarchaeota archaeon]|nr:hypothetical protein [Candidatus Micrarchaeota archaeon]